MGIVELREGYPNDPNFPPVMQVQQSKPATDGSPQGADETSTETMDELDLTLIDKVRRLRPDTVFLE
jgi:hypothetical protein